MDQLLADLERGAQESAAGSTQDPLDQDSYENGHAAQPQPGQQNPPERKKMSAEASREYRRMVKSRQEQRQEQHQQQEPAPGSDQKTASLPAELKDELTNLASLMTPDNKDQIVALGNALMKKWGERPSSEKASEVEQRMRLIKEIEDHIDDKLQESEEENALLASDAEEIVDKISALLESNGLPPTPKRKPGEPIGRALDRIKLWLEYAGTSKSAPDSNGVDRKRKDFGGLQSELPKRKEAGSDFWISQVQQRGRPLS